MSSGYKIKGHYRSRSAKPYDRKTDKPLKPGLVNRVKEWLTPSSWLGSWNKTGSNDTAPLPLAQAPQLLLDQRLAGAQQMEGISSSPPPSSSFVPRPGALANPFLSNPLALLGGSMSNAGLSGISSEAPPPPPPTTVDLTSGVATNPRTTFNMSHTKSSVESKLRTMVNLPQSLRTRGVPSGPVSMETTREDMNTSQDSEGSWIAEDDGSAHEDDSSALSNEKEKEHEQQPQSKNRGQRSEKIRPKAIPTLNLSEVERSDVYRYDLGEGSAGIVQPISSASPVATEAEQVILQVENPAAKMFTSATNMTSSRTQSVDSSSRTMLSSSILNRLYTANPPFAMSTPQLSPVHENREETIHGGDADVAKQPESHSGASRSRFHSQASMLSRAVGDSSLPLSTPSKFHTEESLRRSPFHSPFYSGRTSFGGAASGQKPRLKRPRTESSPPVFAPLRLSVKARPVSSGSKGRKVVASQTARKIMETLGNLSSPLANARKLPMRTLSGETQLSKRRRLSLDTQSTTGTSTAPPIAPLRTPSQPSSLSSTETQLLPSERPSQSTRQQQRPGGNRDGATRTYPNKMPTTSTSLPSSSFSSFAGSKPTFTVPNFSSSEPPKPSSILSGLTFTAPPVSRKPTDHSEEQERQRSPTGSHGNSTTFPPSFSSHTSKNFTRTGGKMKSARRRRHGAPVDEEEEEEEDEGYINPMAAPPAVGLTLGKGGALPSFMFHTQLATSSSKPPGTTPATTQSASTSYSVSTSLSKVRNTPSPSFSFSAPKSVGSESGTPLASEQPPKQAATFGFSAPKDQRLTPTPPPPSSLSLPQFTSQPSKPSPFLTATLKPSPQPATFAPLSKLSSFSAPLTTFNLKQQPKGVQQPPPPPLKAMSVEEALKKPEFQLPLSKSEGKASAEKSDKQEAEVCIVLSDSDDENDSKTRPKSSTAQTKVNLGGKGGLQLGSSGGLKLETSGGLHLGSNAVGMSTIAGAQALQNSVLPVKLVSSSGAPGIGTNLNLLKTDSSTKSSLPPLSQFAPTAGSWECGQCMVSNKVTDGVCVACSAPKPTPLKTKTDTSKSGSAPVFKPLAQFAPASGSWECSQCLVNNQANDTKCVACSAAKPPAKTSTTASSSFSQPGGLSLAGSSFTSAVKPSETLKNLPLGGQLSVGGWSCETCLVQNKASDTKCIACTTAKPATKLSSSAAPPASAGEKWTCGTCLVVNKAEDTKCVACSNSKKSIKPNAVPFNTLSGFAPPTGGWACDTCLVQNKAEDTKCISCTALRPGVKPSDSNGFKPSASFAAATSSGLTLGGSGGIKLGGGLSLAGFSGSSGKNELKLGSTAPVLKDKGAASGGIKINTSLSSLSQSSTDSKTLPIGKGSGLPSVFGLPPQTSDGQTSIAKLSEKNPLSGIKFGVSAPSTAKSVASTISQNPLGGIKFGSPSSTLSTTVPAKTTSSASASSSLQFGLGSTSTLSSPFKLGTTAAGGVMSSSISGNGGRKLGASSMDLQSTQPPAPKLVVGLGQISTSQSPSLGTGSFCSGAQPLGGTGTANPLAGIKFGVSSQPPSSTPSKQLQFPSQLQFGTMASSMTTSSSSSGPSFNFMATTTNTTVSTQSTSLGSPFVFSGAKSSTGTSALSFGSSAPTSATASLQASQQTMNSMLSSGEKPSSSLFAFSGGKDVSKVDSSSPFPSTGGAAGSLGGFSAGGMDRASGLGGGISPFKFGTAQPSTNQPFAFGKSGSGSSGGAVFGKQEQAVPSQGGISLMGQQPSSGLALPSGQGSSLFGTSSQLPQTQPQGPFGSSQLAPFSFSSSQSSTGTGASGLGGAATGLGFPSSTGGLNFGGASATQTFGLGGAPQMAPPSENKPQAFPFDPSAGVNFNFGGGQAPSLGGGGGVRFSAGSSQNSTGTTRVIKKARRRNK